MGDMNAAHGAAVLVCSSGPFLGRAERALRRAGWTPTVLADEPPRLDLDNREALRARVAEIANSTPLALVVVAMLPVEATTPTPVNALHEQSWDAACERPLRIAVQVMEAVYPHLVKSRGSVVVVCPTTGLQGASGFVAMSALSEGLRILAKSAARQWAADGIAVNIVAPPLSALAPEPMRDGRWRDAIRGRIPGDGTYDVDAAMGAVLAFLGSPDSHHLVGVTIPIDSGQVTAL